MTKDPEMKEILEELVDLEEPKMTNEAVMNQEVRNNEEDDENYDRVENQGGRPVTVSSVRVLNDVPLSTTLPSMSRTSSYGNMDGLGVMAVTAVTPTTVTSNQVPIGETDAGLVSSKGTNAGRKSNNTTP